MLFSIKEISLFVNSREVITDNYNSTQNLITEGYAKKQKIDPLWKTQQNLLDAQVYRNLQYS